MSSRHRADWTHTAAVHACQDPHSQAVQAEPQPPRGTDRGLACKGTQTGWEALNSRGCLSSAQTLICCPSSPASSPPAPWSLPVFTCKQTVTAVASQNAPRAAAAPSQDQEDSGSTEARAQHDPQTPRPSPCPLPARGDIVLEWVGLFSAGSGGNQKQENRRQAVTPVSDAV